MYLCIYVNMYLCIYMYVNMYLYIYVYMYLCIYVLIDRSIDFIGGGGEHAFYIVSTRRNERLRVTDI